MGMSKKSVYSGFNVFWTIYMLLAHRFMPKHDGQIQLLLYQIKMLRDRIDDPRIIPTSDERAELLRLGAEIDHDIGEIMKVVKPGTGGCVVETQPFSVFYQLRISLI